MDRRDQAERQTDSDGNGAYRYPSWQEQQVQFSTRYVFLILGFLFFNMVDGIQPSYWTLSQLNLAFAVYFVLNSLLYLHAAKFHIHPRRYHVAMWVDIVIVSICVLNDPYPIPPSLLVFIMVVLGNGMRYGMRLFAESMVGSFTATMVVLTA